MRKLTEAQQAILRTLAAERGEGWMLAAWIAERNGHFYDTPWASGKLPTLLRHRIIEKSGKGYYRITEAGRAALAAMEGKSDAE